MKLKHLLIINAVIALAYGLGELLVPATMLSLYGIAYSPGASLLAQNFGGALIAIGLVAWFARNVTDAQAQLAIILAFFISEGIGVVVLLLGTVSGVMSAVGWSGVGIQLLLALGYAYFLFRRPHTVS